MGKGLQLIFALFVLLLFLVLRHFWRHREIYRRIYAVFSGLQPRETKYSSREKRVVACPHCGSAPELTGEPCSHCGRMI